MDHAETYFRGCNFYKALSAIYDELDEPEETAICNECFEPFEPRDEFQVYCTHCEAEFQRDDDPRIDR